jgi:hypothetical protein
MSQQPQTTAPHEPHAATSHGIRADGPVVREEAAAGSERRWSFVLAMAASLCWTGALALLFLADLHREADPLAPQRLLFYALVLAATLLTFVPLQLALRVPRLAFDGVVSLSLLLYTIAFAPPPTGWLLALPDLPVYVLFLGLLFWSTATVVLPFTYAVGQRLFQQRARRRDTHRARRQAYEVGALVACTAGLAALNVLSWVSLLLLLLIVTLAELLFLSRVRVNVQQQSW